VPKGPKSGKFKTRKGLVQGKSTQVSHVYVDIKYISGFVAIGVSLLIFCLNLYFNGTVVTIVSIFIGMLIFAADQTFYVMIVCREYSHRKVRNMHQLFMPDFVENLSQPTTDSSNPYKNILVDKFF
jgi:hypothetical protein